MLNRLAFALIAVFWLVMNALLWRSEFRAEHEPGATLPLRAVWARILTAPDDSTLEIVQGEQKIGYCRWRANVGQEVSTGKVAEEDNQLEGMVRQLAGYTLDLEGNLLWAESGSRFRFEFHGAFTSAHHWKEWSARVSTRPRTVELRASAADEILHVTIEDGAERFEKRLPFADFQDPMKLLDEFGPALPAILINPSPSILGQKGVALGIQWEARKDWLKIGHSQVRVYRLQARLFDRAQVVVIVSRVGEILRVELPGEIVLENDALANL